MTNPRQWNQFFWSRAASTVGDEMWLVALPIFLSAQGHSSKDVGAVQAFNAVGALVGFAVLPLLARTLKNSRIAVFADALQVAAFFVLAVALLGGVSLSLTLLSLVSVTIAFAAALWFASTETLLSTAVPKEEAQDMHRKNFMAAYAGPILGPSLGGLLLQLGGLMTRRSPCLWPVGRASLRSWVGYSDTPICASWPCFRPL